MQPEMESEKPKKSSQNPKPKKAEIYREVVDIISNSSFTGHKKFPLKLHVYEPQPGVRKILEEFEVGSVRFVPEEYAANALVRYLNIHMGGSSFFALTVKDAKEAVAMWMAERDPIKDMPLIVAEKSYQGLSFRKLPFDFQRREEPTPTFDEFISRCSNNEALKAWIGSLFYPLATRHQYIWIHGEGGDGKGSIARLLMSVFGEAATSKIVPGSGDKRFWTYSLLGKRLVVLPDCNNFSFPNDGLFKSLTGGDIVSYEPKGRDSFAAVPSCMFMFLSNEKPDITGQKANTRRAIYCEVSPIVGNPLPQHIIDARLWAEAPAILGKCLRTYEDLCPDFGEIPVDKDVLDELIADNEEWMSELAQKYFNIDSESMVLASKFQEIKKVEKIDHWGYRNWLAYLRRVHKVKSIRYGDPLHRYYKGVALKDGVAQLLGTVQKENTYKRAE